MHKIAAIAIVAGLTPLAGWQGAHAQSGGLGPAEVGAPKGPAAVSRFTTLELERCRRVSSDPQGGRWTCPGLPGFDIAFGEGDLRQFIGYGKNAKSQRATTQTLGPFNSIFKGSADRTTIEWRGQMKAGRFEPFATIIRYHTDTGDDGNGQRQRGQVLVVSRLGPSNGNDACHVAYIDALANKDANAVAETSADDSARSFDCKHSPARIGEKGKSPMAGKLRT